jgi:hypothetical protein
MKHKSASNEPRHDEDDSDGLTLSVIAGISDEWVLNCDEPLYKSVLRMKAEIFELRVQVIQLQLNDDLSK